MGYWLSAWFGAKIKQVRFLPLRPFFKKGFYMKILFLFLILPNILLAENFPESDYLRELKKGARVEGCVAGLMYYTRDSEVSKSMQEYCGRVIDDVIFSYDFTDKEKIDLKENSFKRDVIKI